MAESLPVKAIMEPAREVPVCQEAEVLVVGGGPAGVAAAVAAARNGARTVLMERYGHLGGMATGGLVILIPYMSDGTSQLKIAGLCEEMIDRLDVMGAAVHPRKEDTGSTDTELTKYWLYKGGRPFVTEGRIRYGANVDPEMLKCVLNDMVEEVGVKLFLHSWGSRAFTRGDEGQGVVFESKSGRQAILAKVLVDTTGDGDMLASIGAGFDAKIDPDLRSSKLALAHRVANVDVKRFYVFREQEPQKYAGLMKELERRGGFTTYWRTERDDVLWCNNWLPGLSALNVEDLTRVEVNARKTMLMSLDFMKQNVPGFEKSFIMDTASQIGTRSSRRLEGEYVVSLQDVRSGTIHDDSIAVIPHLFHCVSPQYPNIYVPYRSLLPRRIENLLVAGRCFSSDGPANNLLNWIPHCIATGQAAGTAAALAIQCGVTPRRVDCTMLQNRLISQGVPLPGVARAGAIT